MSTQVALLRAVNVAGHNKIAMSDLRALLSELGFTGAKSVLQSGNLVFDCQRPMGARLESLLQEETTKRLGVSTEYLVRSADEWTKLVSRNPFPNQAKCDPSHLVVMFLKTAPSAKGIAALRVSIQGPEVIRADGKQLYIVYPAGIGRSKLTATRIEKALGSRGTVRNWNTVLKLAAHCL
jgi:uncharacterized protein (DUF1697 family)